LKNPKRSFQITIKNKSIWEYYLESKYPVNSPLFVEEETARIYCGLTIEQYESLSGTYYWAEKENSIGIYESKSDVLVYYRSQKLIEAIINDLNLKEVKKKK
jgi:hypothetical protein